MTRGQNEEDETAFTDAIYRTNQAFEGSIKEAYRVLEAKDPQRLSPHQIEVYFEKNKVFRDRVLWQFTNYRTNWRNPSTHDHNLDFDEDEAFLAIVSVSAFTKLLVDQIAEKLSFLAAQKDVGSADRAAAANSDAPLVERAVNLLLQFGKHYAANNPSVPIEPEAQLMGALAGFLSSVAPDLRSTTGRLYRGTQPHYVDLEIAKDDENKVLIELKRGQHWQLIETGVRQLKLYMQAAKSVDGILFLFSEKAEEYDVTVVKIKDDLQGRTVHVLRPKGAPPFPNLLAKLQAS